MVTARAAFSRPFLYAMHIDKITLRVYIYSCSCSFSGDLK